MSSLRDLETFEFLCRSYGALKNFITACYKHTTPTGLFTDLLRKQGSYVDIMNNLLQFMCDSDGVVYTFVCYSINMWLLRSHIILFLWRSMNLWLLRSLDGALTTPEAGKHSQCTPTKSIIFSQWWSNRIVLLWRDSAVKKSIYL